MLLAGPEVRTGDLQLLVVLASQHACIFLAVNQAETIALAAAVQRLEKERVVLEKQLLDATKAKSDMAAALTTLKEEAGVKQAEMQDTIQTLEQGRQALRLEKKQLLKRVRGCGCGIGAKVVRWHWVHRLCDGSCHKECRWGGAKAVGWGLCWFEGCGIAEAVGWSDGIVRVRRLLDWAQRLLDDDAVAQEDAPQQRVAARFPNGPAICATPTGIRSTVLCRPEAGIG